MTDRTQDDGMDALTYAEMVIRMAERYEWERISAYTCAARTHTQAVALITLQQEKAQAEARWLALHKAVNAYKAGIMALNPALSEALTAHLPEPHGGDSEY
jgi:hypothetical protein